LLLLRGALRVPLTVPEFREQNVSGLPAVLATETRVGVALTPSVVGRGQRGPGQSEVRLSVVRVTPQERLEPLTGFGGAPGREQQFGQAQNDHIGFFRCEFGGA